MLRKRKVEHLDYIDSSVFLGYVFKQGDNCKKYLDVVGYKAHNKGIISHFVMSEILINLLIKINLDNPIEEDIVKADAFKLVNETIITLREGDRLKILKLTARIMDPELLNELRGFDTKLTDDDALHLIEAIKAKCQFFVTTDKEIINNKGLKENLSKNYNLKIKEIKI